LTEESLRPFVVRRAHSKNGHRAAPPERPKLANEEVPPETSPDVRRSPAEMDLPHESN
jgi:hypothetical protein